jgi:hypothetical protein
MENLAASLGLSGSPKNWTKEQRAVYATASYRRNREKILARCKLRRQKFGKQMSARTRELYYQNHEHVKSYKREHARRWGRKLKAEVIAAYGGKCVCCGITEFAFLTIDHIHGGGEAHRRKVGMGKNFYRWLKRNGFPQEEFRLLCFNCNCARGHLGYCPHERKEVIG